MKFGGLIQSGVILFPKTLYIFLTSLITLQKSWSQKVIVSKKYSYILKWIEKRKSSAFFQSKYYLGWCCLKLLLQQKNVTKKLQNSNKTVR